MAIDLSKKPKRALTPASVRRWPFAAWGRPRVGGGVPWSKLLGVLWRRKGFLLGLVAVVLGLTLAYLNGVTPRYEAEAFVLLDPGGEPAFDVRGGGEGGGAIPGSAATGQGLQREVLLIESRAMAERLVDGLNLHLLPEFNPAISPTRPGLLDGLNLFELLPLVVVHRLPDAWVDAMLAPSPGREMTDLERAELLRERIIDAVLRRIEAEPTEGTTVIGLRFHSADPELAALAANALAEGYLEERREQREQAVERAAAFLAREIERLQESVRRAEARIQDYRRRYGLSEVDGDGAQLEQLTTELALARGARAAAEMRLQQAGRLLGADADLATAAESLDSPTIAELRARVAELNRRKAELSGQYGPGHPEVAELEAEEAELARRMRGEVEGAVQSLRDDVQAALAREAELQARLADLKGRFSVAATDAGGGSVPGELRTLQREAEADRALLETYLTRAVELRADQADGGDEGGGARIISRAVVPDSPAYPPRFLILAVALGAALVVGVAVAFGLEQMDDTFRSGQQIEEILGLPALGLLPIIGDADPGEGPESYVVRKPHSRFGEAVRSLRTALLLPRSSAPPRVVLFTSSIPEEGKTSMAVSLARVNARAGRETLIIDCDLRRPRVHESCGTENRAGLSELLRGARTVDQVLNQEELTGLSFITAGGPEPDPAALLATERMKTLLETLCRRFELIVLDGPPVLSVSDGRVLAQLAEKTVFLVRWGHTRRHDVMAGIRTLTEFGADLAGVVLTRVNVRKHARYGYRDSGYYHDEKYVKYYSG